jgi:hypothetical protein
MGKYSSFRSLMGIAGFPNIFQAKISELIVALELEKPIWMITMHHKGKPGQQTTSFEVCPYQVARSRLASQCPK